MYKSVTIQDEVRVPPQHLGENVEDSVKSGLQETKEGNIESDLGVILSVEGVNDISGGEIEPEDAGVHYEVEYEAVVFEPELHEVIHGEVVDVTGFGVFVRIGPFDGLCHVSQVMDEYVNYDEENNMLVAEEADRTVQDNDLLTTRIIAVSLENEETNKINLTMRQPGLGKDEWIEEYEEEQQEDDEDE